MNADYHVHTYFSDDSTELMENQIEKAIALGINEICFTDHVDYGIKRDFDDPRGIVIRHVVEDGVECDESLANVNYPEYFNKLHEMKEKYKNKITIKQGLEFGVQTHTVDLFNKLFDKYVEQLDFVLLSMHQINDLELWTNDFQNGKTQSEYNRLYYQEILKTMKLYKNYSCLAHLDFITRYDKCGIYPFDNVKEIIKEILIQAIKDDKGIEVNTSSFKYGLIEPQPSKNILKLYKELGGKIITIGSDAHSAKQLDYHVLDVKTMLKEEIWFDEFCTFDKMKPIFHKL